MKIKKIETILKRRKTILLIDDETQWIGDYQAIYPLENLPRLDEVNVFAMFDIPADQQEKYNIIKQPYAQHGEMLKDHVVTDNEVSINPVFSLYSEGSVYLPIRTSQGVKFIPAEYLAPFAKDNITVYERVLDGHLIFVVKVGLFIKSVIHPCAFADNGAAVKSFVHELDRLMIDYTDDVQIFDAE